MVGKLALFVAPTLIANLLIITLSNFEIKAEHCCNSRSCAATLLVAPEDLCPPCRYMPRRLGTPTN